MLKNDVCDDQLGELKKSFSETLNAHVKALSALLLSNIESLREVDVSNTNLSTKCHQYIYILSNGDKAITMKMLQELYHNSIIADIAAEGKMCQGRFYSEEIKQKFCETVDTAKFLYNLLLISFE